MLLDVNFSKHSCRFSCVPSIVHNAHVHCPVTRSASACCRFYTWQVIFLIFPCSFSLPTSTSSITNCSLIPLIGEFSDLWKMFDTLKYSWRNYCAALMSCDYDSVINFWSWQIEFKVVKIKSLWRSATSKDCIIKSEKARQGVFITWTKSNTAVALEFT